MSDLDWVVLVNTGTDILPYGPMEAVDAQAFARFLTKEVDPAVALKLKSPLSEVLGWHQTELARNDKCPCGQGCEELPGWHQTEIARNDCTHGADCPVHPGINGVHGEIVKLGGSDVGR